MTKKEEVEKNNSEKQNKETKQDSVDIAKALDDDSVAETASKVEQLLQSIESNEELKAIIEKFDEKSNEFKFKEILELKEKLIAEVEQLRKERNEYLSLLQRFKADFENYKKRSQKQADNNIRFSSEKIISKIFEPIEDIDRALKFADEKNQDTIPRDGIEIIHGKLQRILEDEEVSLIAPKPGDDFDPRFHEAVCLDPTGKHPPGKVVQLLEKGYKMKNRVLRAAKIMVGAEKEDE